VQAAITKARDTLRLEGHHAEANDPGGSVRGLHYVRKEMADLAAKELPGSNQRRVLDNWLTRFDRTMDDISPLYADARREHARLSRPINQMDVAQSIFDSSFNPLHRDRLAPQAYGRAFSDDTAASATGRRGVTLERTMSNNQLNELEALRAELARLQGTANKGKGIGSNTVQNLAYTNMIDASGVPTWLRHARGVSTAAGAAGRAADLLYGRANREMGVALRDVLLDPERAAAAMRAAAARDAQLEAIARNRTGVSSIIAAPTLTMRPTNERQP
jgi:hypothetical protein